MLKYLKVKKNVFLSRILLSSATNYANKNVEGANVVSPSIFWNSENSEKALEVKTNWYTSVQDGNRDKDEQKTLHEKNGIPNRLIYIGKYMICTRNTDIYQSHKLRRLKRVGIVIRKCEGGEESLGFGWNNYQEKGRWIDSNLDRWTM